jgi:hypothetical protein
MHESTWVSPWTTLLYLLLSGIPAGKILLLYGVSPSATVLIGLRVKTRFSDFPVLFFFQPTHLGNSHYFFIWTRLIIFVLADQAYETTTFSRGPIRLISVVALTHKKTPTRSEVFLVCVDSLLNHV